MRRRACEGAYHAGVAAAAVRRLGRRRGTRQAEPAWSHPSADTIEAALDVLTRLQNVLVRQPRVWGEAGYVCLQWQEGLTSTTLWIAAGRSKVEIDFAEPLQLQGAVERQMGVSIWSAAGREREAALAALDEGERDPAGRRAKPNAAPRKVSAQCSRCGAAVLRTARQLKAAAAGGRLYCPRCRTEKFRPLGSGG